VSDDGKVICAVCSKRAFSGGWVGASEFCVDCYNAFDANQQRAKSAERVASVLQERNTTIQNQNVLLDQELEKDSRMIAARAEIKRLRDRIWVLEQRLRSEGLPIDIKETAASPLP
jgi:uncharacterized Zn finger protein (UPF0148 family)